MTSIASAKATTPRAQPPTSRRLTGLHHSRRRPARPTTFSHPTVAVLVGVRTLKNPVHIWTVQDGKATRYQQLADTKRFCDRR